MSPIRQAMTGVVVAAVVATLGCVGAEGPGQRAVDAPEGVGTAAGQDAGAARATGAGPDPGTKAGSAPASEADTSSHREAGHPAGPQTPGAATDGVAPGVIDALAAPFTEAQLRAVLRHSPLPPPPPDPTNAWADDPRAARLGQQLFYDTALSANDDLSCASCHDPEQGFGDGRSLSEGITEVKRHAPTLWNVAYHRWFYWDGRRDTLWSQAVVPIEHPREMGGNRVEVVRHLAATPGLAAEYEEVFGPLPDVERLPEYGRPIPVAEDHPHARPDMPAHEHPDHPYQLAWDGMSEADREAVNRAFVNVGKAIAAFERRIVSRHAPFDAFVEGLRTGDRDRLAALDASAQRGLALFVGRGQCALCHSGPAFTDKEFHSIAVPPLLPALADDTGRLGGLMEVVHHEFRATGPFGDAPDAPEARKIDYVLDPSGHVDHHAWGQFKTPGLRNVALSPPYMHQGQLRDLEAVVDHYSNVDPGADLRTHVERFLKPLRLDPGERADLVAFLRSLTDASALEGLEGPPEP